MTILEASPRVESKGQSPPASRRSTPTKSRNKGGNSPKDVLTEIIGESDLSNEIAGLVEGGDKKGAAEEKFMESFNFETWSPKEDSVFAKNVKFSWW